MILLQKQPIHPISSQTLSKYREWIPIFILFIQYHSHSSSQNSMVYHLRSMYHIYMYPHSFYATVFPYKRAWKLGHKPDCPSCSLFPMTLNSHCISVMLSSELIHYRCTLNIHKVNSVNCTNQVDYIYWRVFIDPPIKPWRLQAGNSVPKESRSSYRKIKQVLARFLEKLGFSNLESFHQWIF